MAVIALGVLTVFGVRALLRLWNDLGAISSALGHHAIVAIIALKLAFFLTVALHQLVHALACVHYRRRVKEVGFIIHHMVVPTFYADVTDLFMASRRARVVNALAGPTVHLVLGLLGVIWADNLTPGLLQACVAASAVLQLQSFLICIYPFSFLEMDGYHVLEDAVGMPRLSQESSHFVRGPLWRRLAKGRSFSGQEVVYLSYFLLSLLSVLAFVGLNAWLILSAMRVLWHIPLMLSGDLPWVLGTFGNIAFQFLILWIFQRSNQRWFLAVLSHAILDTVGGNFFFRLLEGPDQARLAILMSTGFAIVALTVYFLDRRGLDHMKEANL